LAGRILEGSLGHYKSANLRRNCGGAIKDDVCQDLASASRPAARYTSPAASAFIAAMPNPTRRSGQIDWVAFVTRPARMMAALASTSLRAERNAARPRLPP